MGAKSPTARSGEFPAAFLNGDLLAISLDLDLDLDISFLSLTINLFPTPPGQPSSHPLRISPLPISHQKYEFLRPVILSS